MTTGPSGTYQHIPAHGSSAPVSSGRGEPRRRSRTETDVNVTRFWSGPSETELAVIFNFHNTAVKRLFLDNKRLDLTTHCGLYF